MFRKSGASLQVTEGGFALPLYTSFTVGTVSNVVTYTFSYRGTQVATVTLTYSDATLATLTSGAMTQP